LGGVWSVLTKIRAMGICSVFLQALITISKREAHHTLIRKGALMRLKWINHGSLSSKCHGPVYNRQLLKDWAMINRIILEAGTFRDLDKTLISIKGMLILLQWLYMKNNYHLFLLIGCQKKVSLTQ
jgi:hypothetical protein